MYTQLRFVLLLMTGLSLIACSSTTDDTQNDQTETDSTNTSANNTGGNTTNTPVFSSAFCTNPEVVSVESDDTFVSIDAFLIAPEIPSSITSQDALQQLGDISLYDSASASTLAADLSIVFGPMLAVGLCDAELDNNGRCISRFPGFDGKPGTKTVGGVSGNTLSFDTFVDLPGSITTGTKLSSYSGQTHPYWQGSYTVFADPNDASSTDVTLSWSRSSSSESFNSTSGNGDFIRATEQGDCSGTLTSQTTDEFGVTTIDASWQLNGTTTSGSVTRCIDGDCEQLNW